MTAEGRRTAYVVQGMCQANLGYGRRTVLTLGRTARSSAGSGRGGMLPSLGRCTVVKQMLYSWMMEGYRELKSSSSTMLVYRPFLGSSTSPPAYCALPFLPPVAYTDKCEMGATSQYTRPREAWMIQQHNVSWSSVGYSARTVPWTPGVHRHRLTGSLCPFRIEYTLGQVCLEPGHVNPKVASTSEK